MDKKKMLFNIFQVSVVFSNQQNFLDKTYNDDKEGRNAAFRDVINNVVESKKIKINPRNCEYSLLYVCYITKDLLCFQLAKKKDVKIYKETEDYIEKRTVDSYPFVYMFVNLETQKVFVQVKDSFMSENSMLSNIIKIFNHVLRNVNFSMYLTPIEDIKEFWALTNDSIIKDMEFELVAPNFFNAAGKAKELAEESKKQLNAETTTVKFQNKKGNLKATMSFLKDLVEYSSHAGYWSVVVEQDGKRKRIKSHDVQMKQEIEEYILDLLDKYLIGELKKEQFDNVASYLRNMLK